MLRCSHCAEVCDICALSDNIDAHTSWTDAQSSSHRSRAKPACKPAQQVNLVVVLPEPASPRPSLRASARSLRASASSFLAALKSLEALAISLFAAFISAAAPALSPSRRVSAIQSHNRRWVALHPRYCSRSLIQSAIAGRYL